MVCDKHIGLELKKTTNLIRRKIDNAMAVHGWEKLTHMQGRVINYLCCHEGQAVFQKDLETEFSIRRSTATAILQTMEKHGLIERKAVLQDARLKQILPTETARRRHGLFVAEIERVEQTVLAGITKKEREMLFALLIKIRRNLGENVK